MVMLCRSVIDDREELVGHVEALVEGDGSARKRAILRDRWLFEKSKFITHRQSLESLKTMLNLLVSTMSLSGAHEIPIPDEVQYVSSTAYLVKSSYLI